jgi:SAM-dependent methyltransferase
MDPRHLQELSALEDTYWWHVGKRRLVLSLLRQHFPAARKIVEGGVGGCGNLAALQGAGFQVVGLDLLPEAVECGRQRGLSAVHCHDLSQPWPADTREADVVLMLDVLEHVADPALVLRHAAEILRADGGVIVTVPAYPWLYGPWDEQLGHYRRYTAEQLRDDARAASLNVRWLSHWNVFSLPAALALRMWQRWRSDEAQQTPEVPLFSPAVNRFLLSLAGMERRWLTRRRLPAGLSLVGVLSK